MNFNELFESFDRSVFRLEARTAYKFDEKWLATLSYEDDGTFKDVGVAELGPADHLFRYWHEIFLQSDFQPEQYCG